MIKTEWIQLSVGNKTMWAYVATPVLTGKAPAIFVLQEAFGVNAHMRDVTERFAREGYIAICPELFHRTAPHGFEGSYTDFATVAPHLKAITPETLKSDLSAAFDYLAKQPHVDINRVASIGYCMGGSATFFGNSFLNLKAAVSYYGTAIPRSYMNLISAQKAPLLLVWGGKDTHIQPEQIQEIEKGLKDSNQNYVNVVFGEGDHGFFCDQRSAYHEKTAKEAWALTLAFLKNHL